MPARYPRCPTKLGVKAGLYICLRRRQILAWSAERCRSGWARSRRSGAGVAASIGLQDVFGLRNRLLRRWSGFDVVFEVVELRKDMKVRGIVSSG